MKGWSMTAEEIILLAKMTRDAQKAYFRTRSQFHLQASKQYERQLDKAIEDYTNSKPQLKLQL